MSDKTNAATAADDALKALSAAVEPLAKSAVELVAEATTLFVEAQGYDKSYLETILKAAPAMDADGDYDDDTKKPKTKTGDEPSEMDKAVELRDLAKTAHGVVEAYLQVAEVPAEKPEDSPWVAFAKMVQEHQTTVNATLAKQVEGWRKKAVTLRENMAKADDPKKKEMMDGDAKDMESAAEDCDEAAKMAKAFADSAVWPKPVIKLDKPMTMAKGYMSIQSKDELMRAVEEYKNVALKDQPPVYAHIMDCAKALHEKLPEGWHEPVTLQPDRSASTGSDQTVRTSDITEADKAAAMRKGVTIVGPTAGLLSTLRSLVATTLIERMAENAPKSKAPEELKAWMKKGEDLLKSIVADEAESIRILDIPTFPEVIVKSDHWATAAANVCVETITDDMPIEQRTMRKELAGRLNAAAEVFKKNTTTEDLSKREQDAELLKTVAEERDQLKVQLEKFTSSLVPLTRSAQAQKEELKKVAAERDALKAENEKLKAEPMPSKGRVGEGGALIAKVDDGATTGETGSDDLVKKIDAMPPGAERGRALLNLAYKMRADEAEAAAR